MHYWNACLKENNIDNLNAAISNMYDLSRINDYEKYVNRLIALNIFTHNDIYKKTFRSETFFEDVRQLRAKYVKLLDRFRKPKKSSK